MYKIEMFSRGLEFFKKLLFSSPNILFINFYRLLTRKKVFNLKRLPDDKPAILAINHCTGADPIIVMATLRKKIMFLADSRCFETKFTNFFFRRFANTIPVFKKQFIRNLESFKEVFSLFDASKNKKKNIFLGIFPEGKLNKDNKLDEFFKGTAYLSYKMKIPIIPVYISNIFKAKTKEQWLKRHPVLEGIITIFLNMFRRVHVFIGEPVDPLAESIIKDFHNFTDRNTYRQIIDKINLSLSSEFIELEKEAKKIIGKLSDEKTTPHIPANTPGKYLLEEDEELAEDLD
jgi:1-acyl-sn-glycerol-3-phosphate acyltransferase